MAGKAKLRESKIPGSGRNTHSYILMYSELTRTWTDFHSSGCSVQISRRDVSSVLRPLFPIPVGGGGGEGGEKAGVGVRGGG